MWLSMIEQDNYLSLDKPFPNAPEVLRELRIGNRLTLVTLRHSRDGLDRQLEQLQLTALFDRVVSAPAVGQPAAFKASLIQRLAPASTGWLIGDTEADILAGKALGFTSCGVTSGLRSADILRESSPDYIAEEIGDVLEFVRMHVNPVTPAR